MEVATVSFPRGGSAWAVSLFSCLLGFGLVGGPDRAGPRVMFWLLRGGVGIPSGSLLKHACQLGCLVGAFGAELKCRPDRVHHRAERLFPSLSFPWLCIPALACTYDVHGSSWAARSRYASQFYQPKFSGYASGRSLCSTPPLREPPRLSIQGARPPFPRNPRTSACSCVHAHMHALSLSLQTFSPFCTLHSLPVLIPRVSSRPRGAGLHGQSPVLFLRL